MPLLRLDQIVVNIGTRVLLDHINLTLHRGVRIGLLGRNGEGKTTLMKIIAGSTTPDSGERWLRPGIRVAWLEQVLPHADDQTVFDMVADGLGEVGALLQQYHHLAQAVDTDLDALERVQHALEAQDGWSLQQRVDTIITQLELPAEATMRELSGGWRRRVMLGRALVLDPDILLLDEPTNHLDIPAIEWLEKQLQDFRGAIICVTHDRAFLQAIANRIMELDRGHLTSWDGTYHGFLRFREEKLAAEETANALFDKKLAEEEKWIRQGIKARRTRNEGRVRALKDLRVERSQRREQQGSSKFEIEAAARSGKIVAEVAHVTHAFGDKVVVRNLSCTLLRGDCIGIIGPNGAGKTTLLKILLGELAPQSGSVTMGTNLQVAYFDQLRSQLDPEKNLIDNVLGGQEFIELNGKRRHAITYLGDFLFTPDRVRTPVKALSGGEQARAILAKLFTRPANVLVLDEPTNDLDMETLDLLEELLLDFPGTVLLVSHDREFMDNTVTSVMVMTGNGEVQQLVGGYSDWLAKGGKLQAEAQSTAKPAVTTQAVAATPVTIPKRKLSYKEKQELEALPAQIDQLEKQQQQLEQQISNPAFYAQPKEAIQNTMQQLEHAQQALTQAYERWQFLDS